MKKKNYTPSRSNFQTHKLQFSQSSIKLRPSYKSFLFFGIFAAVGTLIFIIGAIQLPAKDLFGLFIWFALFGGAGFYGIFKTFYKKYPVIDLINNIFYPEGKISKYMIHDDSGIPLKELKKINVERIYHRGSKSSYYYYTLYLDFGNERIFPFLGHGALKLFVQDADKLSSILNVPITPEDEYKSWLSPAKERKNALAMPKNSPRIRSRPLIFEIRMSLIIPLVETFQIIIKTIRMLKAVIMPPIMPSAMYFSESHKHTGSPPIDFILQSSPHTSHPTSLQYSK